MGVCGISQEFLVVIGQITIIFFMQIYSQKCNVYERIETLKWLHEQVGEGFYPRWFITYHLHNPQELVKPIKETAGGSAANTISTLAKLGLKTAYTVSYTHLTLPTSDLV